MKSDTRLESGSGLFMALVAVVVIAGLIAAGTMAMLNTRKLAEHQLRFHGQAISVAKAGLIETLSWFREHPMGQPDQITPTTTKYDYPGYKHFFQPITELNADPPLNETADPSIGIVREFKISTGAGGDIWGRYEVRRIGAFKVKDVSLERFYSDLHDTEDIDGDGDTSELIPDQSAWLIRSVGSVFKKYLPDKYQTTGFYAKKPEDQGDGSEPDYDWESDTRQGYHYALNRWHERFKKQITVADYSKVVVLARVIVGAEIRRFQITPPGQAAVCAHIGSRITIGNRGRVLGSGYAALLYPSWFAGKTTGTPSVSGEVDGMPDQQTVAWEIPATIPPQPVGTPAESLDKNNNGIHDDFEVHMVFPKMSKSDLKAMADIYTNDYTTLPSPLPNYSLVYVDGDPVFSPGEYGDGRKKRLDGCGVLFVDGDLTIAASSNSVYRGLIYCTGDYKQEAPSLISGTVISCDEALSAPAASVRISGEGDYSEFDYDPSILDLIEKKMSNYRFSRSIYVINPKADNAEEL